MPPPLEACAEVLRSLEPEVKCLALSGGHVVKAMPLATVLGAGDSQSIPSDVWNPERQEVEDHRVQSRYGNSLEEGSQRNTKNVRNSLSRLLFFL